MLIKVLVENTAVSKKYKKVHGLSLYIETKQHKILFDLGPGKIVFDNAKKLGVNIEDIDIVVISHGHYDHGGALKTFLERNKKAVIYLGKNAFQPYYTTILWHKYYIGLDRSLENNDRFIFTDDNTYIDEELQLFAGISERNCSFEYKNMFRKDGRSYVKDTFEHEQGLLIREGDKVTLVSGCAHTGIVNIMDRGILEVNQNIDYAISGFHLYELSASKKNEQEYLDHLTDTLKAYPTQFYTCHCTGTKIYDYLRDRMGEQLNYLSTGQSIEL